MNAYILDPARKDSSLVTSGAALFAPAYVMRLNPDATQPHPYNLPGSEVDAYADEIAEVLSTQPDGARILNVVGLLSSCADIGWDEPVHGDEKSITKGLISGTWRCPYVVNRLDEVAQSLQRRGVEFDDLLSDFEVAAASNDQRYADVYHIWRMSTAGDTSPAAFDKRVRQVGENTTRAIMGAIGWNKPRLIQVNQSLHFDTPFAGCFTTLHSIDDVPTFRAKLQAAKDAGCIGVLIDTAASVTPEHLESHRAALQALTSV